MLMLLLALVLFGVILLLSGKNPIQAYVDIFRSTLGSPYGFSEVIVAMVPMVITAVAVALPSRVGLINVGVEGQLYMGACLATWGALTFTHCRLGFAAAHDAVRDARGGGMGFHPRLSQGDRAGQ